MRHARRHKQCNHATPRGHKPCNHATCPRIMSFGTPQGLSVTDIGTYIHTYIQHKMRTCCTITKLTNARNNARNYSFAKILLWLAILYTNSKSSRLVFQVALTVPLAFKNLLISALQFEKQRSRTLHCGRGQQQKA